MILYTTSVTCLEAIRVLRINIRKCVEMESDRVKSVLTGDRQVTSPDR